MQKDWSWLAGNSEMVNKTFLISFPPLFNKAAFLTEETTWWNISELLWDPDHMATGLGRRNRGQGLFAPTPYFGRFVNPIPIRGTDYGHIINTCPPPKKKKFRPSAGSTGKADIFQGRPHFLWQLFFWHLLLFQCRHKKKLRERGKKFWELLQIVRSLHSRLWAHNKEVPTFLAKLGVWKSKCYTKTKTCFIYILDSSFSSSSKFWSSKFPSNSICS